MESCKFIWTHTNSSSYELPDRVQQARCEGNLMRPQAWLIASLQCFILCTHGTIKTDRMEKMCYFILGKLVWAKLFTLLLHYITVRNISYKSPSKHNPIVYQICNKTQSYRNEPWSHSETRKKQKEPTRCHRLAEVSFSKGQANLCQKPQHLFLLKGDVLLRSSM